MDQTAITQQEIDELHGILLKALVEIRRVCDAHGLTYFLYCGTLLGCIRHGGFIPWDNDIDLTMPLDDYYRFLEIAPKELSPGYELQHYGNNRDYPRLFARVCIDGTTAIRMEYIEREIHQGICIDIYPMIGTRKTRKGIERQQAAMRFARGARSLNCRVRYEGAKDWKTRIWKMIPEFLRNAAADAEIRWTFLSPAHTERVCSVDTSYFFPKYRSAQWKDSILKPFEGELFKIPKEYDALLTVMYGDYMTLPPESKRVLKFADEGVDIVDIHRDYREYRDEIIRQRKSH